MAKIAVVVYGPPGSGKTIQADLLARALNLIHFDVGPFLTEIIYEPKKKNNRFIQAQRKIFEKGGLCDPRWVARLVAQRIQKISRAGFGVVLSGSLRTMTETFGGAKREKGLLSVFEKLYGRRDIIFFELLVSAETSLRRNRDRFVCEVCGRPVLTEFFRARRCPLCGGKLKRRVLDSPAIIKERLREYRVLTQPVHKELEQRGYRIYRIDGARAPFLTHARILSRITRWRS